ncbi:NmrA-like negative transcriptional regulator family protein [Prunus dulcis]|uniref:NmrA-like negative transcriptional regulator family protein n=1 Tax=Prunus dulcis TaxID=3755 RepID=A0A4Y1RE08_PRUDU|nr:NmrA-like negative transcriptional regulator family protein [Prunus dulcis]
MGYLGKFMVKASLSLGHPTYAYVRPIKPSNDSSRLELLKEFEAMGLTIFQGELDEHEKLVAALKQVDVVISTLPIPQLLEQFKIINAIKDVGNIKRFIPSEFGNDPARESTLAPFEAIHEDRRTIRRATEAAEIPHTYVCGNTFGSYFVSYLLNPHEERDEVVVYGTGEAKVVMNYEQDIATYTIKAATDPRAANNTITCRPKETLYLTLPHADNVRASIAHDIFVVGQVYEFTENNLEASKLYPEYKYTSIDSFLDICLVDPPKPKLAAL